MQNTKMGSPNNKGHVELKKGPWTREEDQKLLSYIQQYGHGNWRNLPAKAGLLRCGKSCRLRWTNYLRPDITRGKFSTQEEKTIIRLHALLGNRWAAIAAHLPKRTDNEIKNYWNTRLKKRLTRLGIDPVTHLPKNNPAGSADQSRLAATLSHMAQWETARLEAEARLTRQTKTLSDIRLRHKSTAPPPPDKAWQATATIPSCLLSSNGTLESPTSTLGNSLTVPTVSSIMANGVVSKNGYGALGLGLLDSYTETRGKTENPLQLHDDTNVNYPVGFCDVMMMGSMDQGTYNHDTDGYKHAGDLEDGNENYWNDLLNLVRSPME